MNKVEAMEWAADFAERSKVFDVPTNSRGYIQDGAKVLSPAEKSRIIIELANSVVDSE